MYWLAVENEMDTEIGQSRCLGRIARSLLLQRGQLLQAMNSIRSSTMPYNNLSARLSLDAEFMDPVQR